MPYTFGHGSRPLEGITIQRAVGRGGFGEVYYALTDSGKQIALKYLRDNPEIELRGIAHVMNLKSPHLITIYDVRENAEGEPFVVMEYVTGPSLRDLVVGAPRGLGPQKAAFFVEGIARGLKYLHDRGIVHRDLKPANIFYDDGYVKIGDYGLSKHISVSKHSGQTVSVGTVHYMAPEIGSGSYTKAIDIYALGVIFYEMLTGRLPFTGSSMGEILMRHLSDHPDLAGIPEPFAAVIAKALAKDPTDRYQDAGEMADALRQHVDISESIASFDPTTLYDVPRQTPAADVESEPLTQVRGADATLTTPPRIPPPPPLDVRAAAASGPSAVLAHRLQQKADKLARKLQQKAEKLRRKRGWPEVPHGWHGDRPLHPTDAPAGSARDTKPVARSRRGGQLLLLLGVIVAVAFGLSFLVRGQHQAERTVALALCLAAGTFGPLAAYFYGLSRAPVRGPVWERLAYMAVTALFMIPAFGIASDTTVTARDLRKHSPRFVTADVGRNDHFVNIFFAPLAVLLVCDWTRRIETGRCGQVRGRDAFWPAAVGLVAATIAHAGGFMFVAAGLCATMSLLTQGAAAMWPYPGLRGAPGEAQAGSGDRSFGRRRGRWHRGPVPLPPATDQTQLQAAEASPAEQQPPAPIIVDASEPSFVGRAADAGTALLSRLLLFGGIVLAVVRPALFSHPVVTRIGRPFGVALPEPLLLALIALGGLLLVLARRRAGGAHMARGCLGGALLLWAAVVALGPAAGAIAELATTPNWAALAWGRLAGPLVGVAVPLLVAFLLLIWPKREANRTIMV